MSKQAQEFWTSDEGILIRLEDLSHDFVFKVYNGAVRAYAKDAGFKKFKWISVLGLTTCKYCENQHGRIYRVGQFLPKIPAHVGCNCFWDCLIEAGKL